MNTIPLRSGLSGAVAQLGRLLTQRRWTLHHSTPHRTTVQPDQVYWIAQGYRNLRVIAGRAWLTQGGRDFVLSPGQPIDLKPDRNGAVLTALRNQAVTVELR